MKPTLPVMHCESDRPCDSGVFSAWVSDLVVRHRTRLTALVRREGLVGEDAFDGVQEAFQTFLTLPQARTLAGDAEASGRMLTTLARNAARSRRRRVRLEQRRTGHGVGIEGVADDRVADAHALLARAEARVSLHQCVAALTNVQRAVVTLRMLGDVPGDQVAMALGLSPQHVAVLLYRAKASLRGCMAARGHGGSGEQGEPE